MAVKTGFELSLNPEYDPATSVELQESGKDSHGREVANETHSKTSVSALWEGLKTKIGGFAASASATASPLWEEFKSKVSELGNSIGTAVGNIVYPLFNAKTEVEKEKIKEVAKAIAASFVLIGIAALGGALMFGLAFAAPLLGALIFGGLVFLLFTSYMYVPMIVVGPERYFERSKEISAEQKNLKT